MMSLKQTKAHYAKHKTCCNAGELNMSANLRCPCCGYLATQLSPQMLEDIHRADAVLPVIVSIKRTDVYGSCTLFATYDSGMEKRLFSYYLDELTFSDSELVGLTEEQAHKLRQQRDEAYLRS